MPRGRPKKPPEELGERLHVMLRPVDMQRLGALMVAGETPSAAIRRVLEWAYIMRIESRGER